MIHKYPVRKSHLLVDPPNWAYNLSHLTSDRELQLTPLPVLGLPCTDAIPLEMTVLIPERLASPHTPAWPKQWSYPPNHVTFPRAN